MPRLTKEQVTEPLPEQTEEFYIPSKGGDVLLRGITDVRTMDALNAEIRLKSAAAGRNIPPFQGMTLEEVVRAVWLSKGLCDPELTFEEAVAFGREVGPVAEVMVGRITALSGLSALGLEKREAELKADGFPAPAPEGES